MKRFLNSNISTKILIGFGIILLLFGGVTLANIRSAAGIQNTSEYVKDIRYQNDQDVVRMVGLATVIEANILSAADAELMEQFVKVQAQAEEFNELLGSLKKSVHLSDKTRNRLLEVEALLPELLTAGEEMVTYAVEQEYVELLPARERYKDVAARFRRAGSQLRAASTESFTLQMESISAQVRRSVKLSVIILLVALACSILLVVIISRSITLPLKKAIRTIEKLSLGDTSGSIPAGKPVNCSSIRNCGIKDCPSYGKEDHCWISSGSFAVIKHCPNAIKGEDCRNCNLYGVKTETEELGSIISALSNNLNEKEEIALRISEGDLTADVPIASEMDALSIAMKKMSDSLRRIIGQVKTAGEEIASGAAQVSDASQTLSQGATEQATSLEEINSSMMEMASQTKTSAENAAEADKLARVARVSADDGNKKMQEMVSAMAGIDQSSQSISKIIKVIDEIAFQTNLLALNAAVEAARAGKHGKGFAVVAEEVRNLAARSSQAAKETAVLIESSVERTQNGSETASETAAKLDEIVESVSKVTGLVEEIATSSNEQALGISQVNEGLTQIDNITQRNTANAEESAAASEELSGQAASLRELLTLFTIGIKEGSSPQQLVIEQGGGREIENFAPEEQEYIYKDEPNRVISLDDHDFGKYGNNLN